MGTPHLLQRLMVRRIAALGEHLPGALAGDVRGVHQARVATRRLREAVPVVGAATPRDKARRRLQRRLRRLTRALGPVRELDVALQLIDELEQRFPPERHGLAAVRAMVAREREARRAFLVHRYDDAKSARLMARLEAFADALPRPDRAPAWRETLAQRASRRAHALQQAIADAGALFVVERLHAVRIAVKKLRYALELAGETRAAATASMLRRLKETQELLGRMHDVDVLLGLARAAATSAADPGITASLDRLADPLVGEMRRLHAAYLRRQSALVRLADQVLDRTVPRLEAPGHAGTVVRRQAAR